MILRDQADISCIFHDGNFAKFIRNQSDVEFIADIRYLTKIINPIFSSFKGKLKNCTKLEYHIRGKESKIIDDLDSLSALYLEIASAAIIDNHIAVECYSSAGECGGDLVIVCDDITICDESGQEITLEKLDEICKFYWNSDHKY